MVWPAGMSDKPVVFLDWFVFDHIQTIEADNEIPESHPESSSAFGQAFCFSAVRSALCNLLPGRLHWPQHHEAADILFACNLPYCFFQTKFLKRSLYLGSRRRCLLCHKPQARGRQEGRHVFSYGSKRSIPYLCHSLLMQLSKLSVC